MNECIHKYLWVCVCAYIVITCNKCCGRYLSSICSWFTEEECPGLSGLRWYAQIRAHGPLFKHLGPRVLENAPPHSPFFLTKEKEMGTGNWLLLQEDYFNQASDLYSIHVKKIFFFPSKCHLKPKLQILINEFILGFFLECGNWAKELCTFSVNTPTEINKSFQKILCFKTHLQYTQVKLGHFFLIIWTCCFFDKKNIMSYFSLFVAIMNNDAIMKRKLTL